MRKTITEFLTGLVWALFLTNPLGAEPLEDARAQFRQGNFDGVESVLASALETDSPPVEALKLSFDAARKSGKIYTAERRVRVLIEQMGEREPLWIYQGAQVAMDLGQTPLAMDRLMYFVRNQKEKSPELKRALHMLSRHSLIPEAFETYVKQYPDDADFNLGFRMLERIQSNSQPQGFLEMASMLLGNFDDATHTERVHRKIYDALQSRMQGLERDDAFAAMRAGKVSSFEVLEEMIGRMGIGMSELMGLQRAAGRPFPEAILKRFSELDRLKNPQIRSALASEYLSLDGMYRQSGDPDLYRNYLYLIFSQEDVFIPKEVRLITEAKVVEMFKALAAMYPAEARQVLQWSAAVMFRSTRDTPHRFVDERSLRTELMRTYPRAFRAEELVGLLEGNETNARSIEALVQLSGDRRDVRLRLLENMDKAEMGGLLARTAGEELLLNPTAFDATLLARYFLNASSLTDAAKIEVLSKVVTETGTPVGLKALVEHRDARVKDRAPFQAWLQQLNPAAKPKDPILAILIEVEGDNDLRSGNEPKPAFNRKIEEAFVAYGAPFPSERVAPTRTAYMERLLALYRNTADNRNEGRRTYAQLVSPRLSAAADWEDHMDFSIRSAGNDGEAAYYVAKSGLKTLGRYHALFKYATHPKAAEGTALFPAQLEGLSATDRLYYLERNRSRLTPSRLVSELEATLKAGEMGDAKNRRMRNVLGSLREAKEKDKALTLPLDFLGENIFGVGTNGRLVWDWEVRREMLRIYDRAGKVKEGMQQLTQSIKAVRNPVERMNALLGGLYGDRDLIPTGNLQGDLEPGTKLQAFLEQVLPAMRDLSPAQRSGIYLSNDLYRGLSWLTGQRDLSDARKALIQDLQNEIMITQAYGASGDGQWSEMRGIIDDTLNLAFERKDMDLVFALITEAGRQAVNTDARGVSNVLNPLETRGALEAMLLATQLIQTDNPDARALLNQARALAGSQVQGIYPVDANAPEYPLFVAADELARNNAEQAWNLLRTHLAVFERDPLLYPGPFVGWALDKLREAKGEDGAWLTLSQELGDRILARENEITAELKAQVLLNRAEIFREKQDFEAARLEYRTLRSNPELQATPFGRQAMFRDVDLMIAMGNASAAEGLIEYWLSNPDPELQVKAYYFRALMAFNDGDNDTTRENLEKVFDLDFTNTDARLLHGKWRLRTNYEVDNPEVLLGTLRDRTILRPGQPLRISVQDPNLSVVGGGSAIPVVIRSSNGGDEERISLFPSTRDPRLFRGSIDTQLAKASPDSQVLEINGRDVVSYEIDPEFLSTRGMTSGEPKRLRVVDDARLAVSAGQILSEAEQQAMEVEAQMSGDNPNADRMITQVRPGNPFYVMVRDRDRSDGSADNQIVVSARTSSGDELRGVVLRETAPYSGEFRGEVPTALPPPRAFASDSAEGIDPGVVINNKREGVWRSRSDGVQGKWIQADTMNSQEVKQVVLRTADAARIAQIRLYGSLMGEERLMGVFPERQVSSGGVKVQTSSATLRSLVEYRKHFSELKTVPETSQGFALDVKENGRRFHVQGAFWLPEDRNLRLRLLPLRDQDHSMNDLWVDILVDGEKVVGGRGRDLRNNTIHLSLKQGGHLLEAFGYAREGRDSFQLGIEQSDGSVQPIPAEWFSVEAQPELADFLKDRALIRRQNDTWVASFAEPERLRSVRWEFASYAGDSLQVSEFRIEDAQGKPVLPGPTDFTDALENDVLEIAPGDTVSVSYEDAVTTEGQRRMLTRQLTSQFTNGQIAFFYEALRAGQQGMQQALYPAYRFRPGDEFLVVVTDGDLDLSPGVDTVDIQVSTRSGQRLTLTAAEQPAENAREGDPVHSDRFIALLRTTEEGATGGDTLKVSMGDLISVSYLDVENTSPGIPMARQSELASVQRADPVITLFHTWQEAVEDTSEEAQSKLEQIRKRTGNRNVDPIMRWTNSGMPMSSETLSTEIIPINADTPLPFEVYLPSQAMHQGSTLTLRVLTESEKRRAAAEGRAPEVITLPMGLGRGSAGLRIIANPDMGDLIQVEPEPNATFGTSLRFLLGPTQALEDVAGTVIPVQGNDRLVLALYGEGNERLFEKQFQLVSEGRIALKDSSYEAGRHHIHLGERFFVQVTDTERDVSPEMDEVQVEVRSSRHGKTLTLPLRETQPHSGVFTGVMLPRFLKPEGVELDNATVDPNDALVGIPTLEVAFGEQVLFSYSDESTLPIREPGKREVTGSIFEGSDGNLMSFTKYFPDAEMAVRVQFRLAESLFEMAKDYRKLQQKDRSSEAIAEGRRILEEALMNYPDSLLAVEGEYLLANLYQEMAAELEEEDPEQSRRHYQDALSRFSAILSGYPDSDFAARAQFHKALCLEKLGDFMRASEEYVKMTYIFPESPLVGDAAIRLATHYYRNEQRYDTAGKIYSNFYRRFPSHPLAPKALFMGAQSHMKQGEIWEEARRTQGMNERDVKTERILDEYRNAVKSLQELIDSDSGEVNAEMRAQAMYWAGDASLRAQDYANAFLFLKRTTFEYPESEWARRSRGLLLQSEKLFEGLQ